jgi:Mg2+-importing ATPase
VALVLAAPAVVLVGAVRPASPLAHTLGFRPLPATFIATLVGMVVGCLALIEFGKCVFYRLAANSGRVRRSYSPARLLRRRAARFSARDLH